MSFLVVILFAPQKAYTLCIYIYIVDILSSILFVVLPFATKWNIHCAMCAHDSFQRLNKYSDTTFTQDSIAFCVSYWSFQFSSVLYSFFSFIFANDNRFYWKIHLTIKFNWNSVLLFASKNTLKQLF